MTPEQKLQYYNAWNKDEIEREIDFFTGDLHLGHDFIVSKNVKQTHQRPWTTLEEHDAALIQRWNNTVPQDALTCIVGDVIFKEDRFPLLDKLNGRKILVKGNHDGHYPIELYAKYFMEIHGALKYKRRIMVTHIPIHPMQVDKRYKYNIHAHLHAETVGDNRYYCVSVDQHDFAPVSFAKITADMARRLG